MAARVAAPIVFALAVLAAGVSAQDVPNDLDALMARVLDRRDANWKALQQYVLEERETFQLTGPGGAPLYGFRREYAWFPRDGFFIRSPLRADGVEIGDAERREAEDAYLSRLQRREARRAALRPAGPDLSSEPGRANAEPAAGGAIDDVIKQSFEPQFIASANFLRFRFDPGQYALAGRERLFDRDVLRIEYYPTKLFTEGRLRPNRRLREEDRHIRERMNKVSLVTLWVDPALEQILQYQFDNIDLDFLPIRSLIRVEGMEASMQMAEPFQGVWLPARVRVRIDLSLALGAVAARYEAEYRDYRQPSVTSTVR